MKRVVVVGGSAGGISALCSLLKALPQDFPAPILAVIHISEEANTLQNVLQRCSTLKVTTPTNAEPIHPGNVYIASPNRHLVVKSGCAMAVMGPRENRHRPAVDTLFRSAARAYRNSVVAVVLSGALDDGSAGALAVKSRGGVVIAQEPADAEVRDMPANVIRQVKTDYCVKLKQIGPLLKRLANKNGAAELPEATTAECEADDTGLSASEHEPIAYTCPECGGALLQVKDGKVTQFRCHVGHRFSLADFTEAQTDAVERALWVALRKLQERQNINEQLAQDKSTSADMRRRFKENVTAATHDIKMLEEVLTRI